MPDASKKKVEVYLRLSLWSWCRETALSQGTKGVSTFIRGVLEKARAAEAGFSEADAEELEESEEKLTSREMTERKQSVVDAWVMSKIEQPGFLDSLPTSMQADLIKNRLPKMGVSKGEMEEKALSLRGALKGIAEYEDIQAELVTLREECHRLRRANELLEAEASMARSDATLEEKLRGMLDLAYGWREMIGEALRGREAAERCGMLRKDKLVEVWKRGAMKIAGVALDVKLVEDAP